MSPVHAGSLPPPPISADSVPTAPTSPCSEGYVETDSEEDRFHGYRTPVPKGDALGVIHCGPECFICPVCPNKKPRKSMDDMEKHVVSLARLYNDKFSSRHRQVARNHGWMPPLLQQQQSNMDKGTNKQAMEGAAASKRSNVNPVNEPVEKRDHVVVESVPQHGRERAGTELSFVVSPGVAKIIRSEVEDEMSESDFFGDIMWDIGLREKRSHQEEGEGHGRRPGEEHTHEGQRGTRR
ncbi:hypothetical protein EJB05_50152, partial [Eragrostis curvula]